MIDPQPFVISLKLGIIVTALLFVAAYPAALWTVFGKGRFKTFAETLLTLPMVMPPTVIGFYLLLAFSRNSAVGKMYEGVFGTTLLFSFTGIVIASCIYSFPFVYQPLKAGLESVDRSMIEASYTLGRSRTETFFRVIMPNMKPSIITAAAMSFAHCMGEFGAVLMVGGNIPGVTRVASIAVYDKVEQLDYAQAHAYAAALLAVSFVMLFTVNLLNRKVKI